MLITVHVRAGAALTGITQLSASQFRIWTPVAPEKGKANMQVQKLLAKHLGVSPSNFELVKGHTSSKKTFLFKNHS